MDGTITIGTELKTDKFDKQIENLEKQMQKEENRKIKIEADIGSLKQEFEIARQKTDELADAYQRLEQLQKTIASGKATPQQFTAFQNLQNTYGTMEKLELSFLKSLNAQDALEQKVEQTNLKYQEVNDKVAEYKRRIENVKLEKQVAEVNKMKSAFASAGLSMGGLVKTALKLVFTIFSIRSAYLAVSQAMTTLSQYNEGLSRQIQAIKLSLATAIEPIVNFIVNLVGKAVSLLGYILKTLFGIDIFARATALNFNKINAGAKGTTKAVKELKKQLTGFDEINILNKDGTTGVGGALGGTSQGVADLSKELETLNDQGAEVAANIRKWFLGSDKVDFKGIWEDNLKIIGDFLTNMKTAFKPIADWVKKNVWDPIKSNFKTAIKAMEPVLKPLKSAFKSVVTAFKSYWTSFKKFFKDKIIKPIKDAFSGIGKALYNAVVPYLNQVIKAVNTFLKPFGIQINELKTKEVKGGGGGFRAHGGIFYPSKLPKLASGGIINQPGSGSLYNGAIIGERGAEAVVPLTDNQQMELLGRTIGKYITVNANIVNSMNGRVISRELKQIQNEQNFAYNM